MLSSLQCGLAALGQEVESALIGLGDQPQLSLESARKVAAAFESTGARLIVPSYNRRRGHPWLVARPWWDELLRMKPPESPRDFLRRHSGEIQHVQVNTPSILADLDTPEDYQQFRPQA